MIGDLGDALAQYSGKDILVLEFTHSKWKLIASHSMLSISAYGSDGPLTFGSMYLLHTQSYST